MSYLTLFSQNDIDEIEQNLGGWNHLPSDIKIISAEEFFMGMHTYIKGPAFSKQVFENKNPLFKTKRLDAILFTIAYPEVVNKLGFGLVYTRAGVYHIQYGPIKDWDDFRDGFARQFIGDNS